jgi:RNase H-fold protein (predicted Holliday junction resolvase)
MANCQLFESVGLETLLVGVPTKKNNEKKEKAARSEKLSSRLVFARLDFWWRKVE